MNVISLSKKKFQRLEPLQLSREIFNTEGKLFNFTYRGKEKVFKKLFHQNGNIFANKLYTLEMLDTNKDRIGEEFCLPDYLITVGGSVEGFTTPKRDGVNLSSFLSDRRLSQKEHLNYLKKVGILLEEMSLARKYNGLDGFFLNDLHDSNFIANPEDGSLSVVDLDSCKIGTNVAFPARFLTPASLLNSAKEKYKINSDDSLGYVTADENSDLYCYNIMVMNYLFGSNVDSSMDLSEFYNYLNYLESIGVHRELLDSFSRLVINRPNINPMESLDSLTDENVCRAKKIVYDKVKKK